ncbi:uncharacterized protein BCR38DRAFT_216779 [Pseudomassariella vexata]|uniref:Uncharacterized protein n=1 Tax=Pseudomassariella vexata TaxID=1141098 RepID=A0A1Y2DUL7_9PEZI|nr:uncharacterized protein BCR38DRAFT_216779 [Pseudomassariella vexata]ORY62889.1 hypothetical protein BCR38DRAFT_216779 [Pseudomassariella vexata]
MREHMHMPPCPIPPPFRFMLGEAWADSSSLGKPGPGKTTSKKPDEARDREALEWKPRPLKPPTQSEKNITKKCCLHAARTDNSAYQHCRHVNANQFSTVKSYQYQYILLLTCSNVFIRAGEFYKVPLVSAQHQMDLNQSVRQIQTWLDSVWKPQLYILPPSVSTVAPDRQLEAFTAMPFVSSPIRSTI